jgi:hypothetical protein
MIRVVAKDEHDRNHDGLVEQHRLDCFLRGSREPFPLHLEKGTLILSGSQAIWQPEGHRRRHRLHLDGPVESVSTREADRRESDAYKKVGLGVMGASGVSILVMPHFMVVTCETPLGAIDIVVVSKDAPLVAEFFGRLITQ